jgi:signal transduction histidine kinase
VETPQESLDRLREEVAKLRASRHGSALADDAERRGIERELHDGPQQALVALAVKLQLARDLLDSDPVAAKELLEEMGGDVQRALDETAKLAHRIYPPLLEAGGLAAALRAAAVSAGVRTKIEVATLDGCPPELAGAVYFCCRAGLERVGAGAQATIVVRIADGALVFELVQDEPGAAESGSERAFELQCDRVEALGGRLTIRSDPGHGIRVSGSLPVSP